MAAVFPKAGDITKGTDKAARGMLTLTKATLPATGAIGGVSKVLAKMGPSGIAAASGVLVATAAIAATVGVMYEMATAAIEVTQQRAKLEATFGALGGGAAQGKATLAMVDSLATKLPFSTAKIAEMAQGLMAAGFRGKALEVAVTSVAAATALMGESGGAAAEKMLKTLAEGGAGATKMVKAIQTGGPKANKALADMGLSVNDIGTAAQRAKMTSDQMGKAIEAALAKKGAGPLAEMGATFPAMAAKLKDGLSGLFEGLGPSVKPFMTAMQQLVAQFAKGGGAFKALKPIVTAVFGAVFKYATMAVHAVSGFVKSMSAGGKSSSTWTTIKTVIGKVGDVLKVVGAALFKVFSNAMVLQGIKIIFIAIAIAIGVVIAIVLAVVAAFAFVAAGVAMAVAAIVDFVSDCMSTLQGWEDSAVEAAANFISGLISGISAGASAVISAVSGLADSALGAFKGVLGIHSPSAVMAKMGDHVATGAAEGIDDGAGKVESAAKGMGAGVTGGAAKGMGGGGSGGSKGGSRTINIEAGALVIHAGGSTVTDEGLALALERLLATQGLA